ncbi:hypothetical protein LPJ75_003269 [Coemansia sp. RSA 2598]|nr:hypothetical protein LPJ75_003269 [Coemansia sp. RSA 2598]
MLSEGPPSDGRGSDLPGQKQKQHQEQEQPGLNTKDIAGGQGVSIWSRIAKLSIKRISLTSEAQTAGDSHLNGQTSQQKAAIDQLREIEASQPAETGIAANKGPDAVSDADFGADASGTAISAEPSNPTSDSPVSETGADGGTLAHSGDNKSTDMTIAQEAGSSNSEAGIREDSVDTGQSDDPSKQAAEARSGWLWGWIGSSKPELGGNMASASSAAAATSTGAVSKNDFPNASPHADDTLSQARSVAANDKHQERSQDSASRPLSAAGDQSLKPPTSRTSQALSEADTAISHGHNTQQQSNVLLPDLDIGQRSNDYAHVPDCADSAQTVDGSLGEEDCAADSAESKHYADEKPLRKRLRTMGKSVMDMFVDMAPDWAQNAVRGQNRADKLGQRQGTSSAHADGQMTSQQIRETMDRAANSLGRIAVVGIHGWFPIRMLQMIAGEPTGKSERFCLMMRDALKSYLSEQHGVEIADKDISLFPLVGEGRIEDRVELLLSQIVDSGEQHEQPRSDAAMDAATARSPSRAGSTSGHHTGTGDRPSALASASASGSMPAATGKQKGKPALVSAAKEKEPGSTADGNGSPAGKQSAMIAEALMPERSKRAQVLQEADTVFVVTHSQGTPVSAMLLERLLELGIIDTSRQRVAMLAMAGISHGPFPYLKDNLVIRYIESEAARELFELMDPSSYQSQRYVAALSMILHKGVRLICAGSWVDEVVPLYSAILQGVSHPNVYRAVYIDAPHYADDFLTNLIAFALRLRNMDIYDHDLLIHLSEVVAGSLWGHWGHSTVYGEPAVYKLSVKWLLYSTSCTSVSASASASVPAAAMGMAAAGHQSHAQASVSGMQIHMSYRPFNAGDKLNPFFIPWIMRTLWDEPEIRQNDSLRIELRRLVALFDKWMPETKAGKELKYRLEPVRAAL